MDKETNEQKKTNLRYPHEDVIASLTEQVAQELDKKRFEHTMSVAYTASCMAMRFGEDPYRAYIAGLLHDCAKCIKDKQKLKLAEKYGLEVNEAEKENPDLLHAKLGSVLAKEKYGITDPQILSAIRWHTTGRPEMTAFEMIIYIADYIEIKRKELPLLSRAREAAFTSLEECMCVILESTLMYLGKKGATVDDITYKTYEYYKNR
ncbi:MAG: bis(5'-nucleosyl)-tetraphosphatase (symmetrical) YqeK [Lachnospiraceae bacterium]|nr:bis(5'-nucleosyl)-tetraphosphatase (symmetrical) YqeK [Lachnospiraceae bacterium]